MEMILQRPILGNGTTYRGVCATRAYQSLPDDRASVSGKQSVPLPYDALLDLESTRSMEERYGIREEGLF